MATHRGRRLTWLIAWAWLTGCFDLGAVYCGSRSRTGGPCNPLSSKEQCPPGDFCARVEVCTHACTRDDDCRASCSVDDAGQAVGCPFGDTCRDGVCSSDVGVRCLDGVCQPPCPSVLADGGCDWDIYGPSDYAKEK
jgi:hypothetical protein